MAKLRGWAFPVEIESTGRIKEVTDAELVRQSIEIILRTIPGERYLYQDFGCRLQSYVFETVNYTTLKQIEMDVRKSIEKWERRVVLLDVKVSSESSERVNLEISYKLQDNETVFNYNYNLNFLI